MKPRSTIIELADTALPIFGDAERDYDFLQALTGYRAVAGGIEADVKSYEERPARARIRFVTPDMVRVQYVLDVEPPASTPMLIEPLPAPPDVRVEDADGALAVTSRSLTVRVDKSPFRWSILGPSGDTVAAQEIRDGALLESISFPGGWSQRPDGPLAFHETLALRPHEQLFGLGECFGQLARRGTRHVAWSRDPYGTNTTPLTYLNIPFFLSTRGYGVFINQTSRAVYELGYPSQVTCSFRFEEPYLDYFVISGPTPKEIIARYWQLTGSGALPPLWSFGAWFSRCMYRDAEQVRGVVERLDELGVPVDVVNVDPRWLEQRKHRERDGCDFVWDREAFGTPEEFIDWLRERRVRLCLWENPYVWRDTEMYREGLERGYFATGPDAEPAPSIENQRDAVVVDFTNPDAARWWQDKHRPYLRAGVAAFKSDYGEGAPIDAWFSDGTTGLETHNALPLLYNRAVWDAIREENGEAIVFGRSGYAGSQRYPLNWVGDTQCTFEGMAAALRAGLSLSLSGIPFWSHDIGGFWNARQPGQPPERELYVRWAQWGLLSSHARFHGIRGREPWWYGDEAVDIVRRYALLRYRLLPYLWSFANEAVETATPLVRPVFMEYPDDPTSVHVDSEYLLGPWLLVAPVFEAGGRVRVYLPPGRWYDFWSGEAIEGSRWLQRTVPLDTVPLYVRDESLLVRGPEMTRVGERPWEPLDVEVRVSSRASLRVEGESAELALDARRDGDALVLDASGRASIVLRFISPAVQAFEVTGDVSDVHEERSEGAVAVSLRLAGGGRIQAR